MKKLLPLLLLGAGLAASQPQPAPLATDQVNALVGNAGYVAAYGHAPRAGTDDDARVRAHLAYAESQLRQRPTDGLTPAQAQGRAHLLDLLHGYWAAGVFPRNYDHPEGRRPCFIDRDGRLCAVGYLVAATAGRPLAERINQAHQYDLIADMRTPALARWVQASGLTAAECALIQPSYGPAAPAERIGVPVATEYAVPSAVWGGLNAAFGAVNATQLGQASPGSAAGWLGLVSGTGQVVLGTLNLPTDPAPEPYFGWGNPPPVQSFAAERTVSFLNIGVGTATAALSAWNLLSHRPPGTQRTAVGVVNFPGRAGGAGVALTRRF